MKKIVPIICLLTTIMSWTGCVTSTKVSIYTDVEGADVFIDNKKIGQTPIIKYKMKNIAWEDEVIIIRKEGYEEVNRYMYKEIKWWNAITGYFFLIPLIWSYGPKPEQHYLLTPLRPNQGPEVQ